MLALTALACQLFAKDQTAPDETPPAEPEISESVKATQMLPAVIFEEAIPTEPPAPTQVVKLVFIHHSVGNYWLRDSNGGLRQTLNANNYFVLDVDRNWGPPDEDGGSGTIGDHTNIGYWFSRIHRLPRSKGITFKRG